MKKLAERNRDKLLDLLNERLTFERAGVRLYDTIIGKMKKAGEKEVVGSMLGQMKEHRDQEKEHEEWLEEQIRALGGDAHASSEMADLVERESKGIEEVVADDVELPHLFHALLTAELVDDAGWKLLLEIADDADDDEARRELRRRAHEEEDHLIFVRRVVAAFARRQVLRQNAPMPASP
jgi:hypothetical protein